MDGRGCPPLLASGDCVCRCIELGWTSLCEVASRPIRSWLTAAEEDTDVSTWVFFLNFLDLVAAVVTSSVVLLSCGRPELDELDFVSSASRFDRCLTLYSPTSLCSSWTSVCSTGFERMVQCAV